MYRRSLIKNTGLGLGVAISTKPIPIPALAQHKKKLTMVTSWARGLAGVFEAAQRVADNIYTMSEGTLEISIKAPGELVGAYEVFDAVSSGQADLYHSADSNFIGQHPGFAFFTGVPFGMTATEHNNWWYHMGGRELNDELTELFNLKTFLAGNTTSQAGGWFHKPINSPDDFKGLKYRMPGLGGKALGYMGASVQNIPGAEVYQALSSGAIDGTEWIGPWADEKAGFQKITKFYYIAGFHEPCAALSCAINKDVFESLSTTHQKIIEAACGEANIWNMTQYLANNGAALQRLISQGVVISEFPDSIWDAFGEASKRVYEENMADELFKKIFESYNDSLKKSAQWISQSESVYQYQRNRVLG